jgi:hypothetical protein
MGDADQSPLGFVLFKASRVKSSKAHVVFHISESIFGLDTVLLPQGEALLGEQVLSGLLAYSRSLRLAWIRRLPLALVH